MTTPAAPPPRLDRLPLTDGEGRFLAVVEARQGSRNKLKYDPALGVLVLHAVLPLGTAFPYDFGFLPSTRGEDGDPLDVLLLMDEAVMPGTVVPCRLIGVIEAEQREDGGKGPPVRNDRLLAVAAETHRWHECRAIGDLPTSVLDELERFFVFYNRQKGVDFRPLARRGPAAARRLVAAGRKAFAAG